MLYSKWICILFTIKPSKMHIYSNQTLPCDTLGYSVWHKEIVSVDTWGLCLPFSTGPDYARFWVTKPIVSDWPRVLGVFMQPLPHHYFIITKTVFIVVSAVGVLVFSGYFHRLFGFSVMWLLADFIVWLSGDVFPTFQEMCCMFQHHAQLSLLFCFAWLIRFIFNSFPF